MSTENRKPVRGLGRGLSTLLSEGEQAEAIGADTGPSSRRAGSNSGVHTIPIGLIEPNPDQPRKMFAEAELAELAASIAQKGLLQPILVRPLPGKIERYQIVAGERRWRAAQRARLHEAPCLIREITDCETLEISIVENVQRADLNPVEEARAFRQLVKTFGHTQDDVAQVVGKSRAHVANTLRLLTLPKSVLHHLEEGALTAGHARALVNTSDPEALANQIIEQGLSVRAAETLARKRSDDSSERGERSSDRGVQPKNADTRALESDLAARLGLQVEIKAKGERGEVRVRFTNLEQLDDLCRRLTSGGGITTY